MYLSTGNSHSSLVLDRMAIHHSVPLAIRAGRFSFNCPFRETSTGGFTRHAFFNSPGRLRESSADRDRECRNGSFGFLKPPLVSPRIPMLLYI